MTLAHVAAPSAPGDSELQTLCVLSGQKQDQSDRRFLFFFKVTFLIGKFDIFKGKIKLAFEPILKMYPDLGSVQTQINEFIIKMKAHIFILKEEKKVY